MDRIISCEFNIDTACVEVKYQDGSMIAIDCTRVENEVARNMYEASEVDWLVYNAPADYMNLLLHGDIREYLRNTTDYHENSGTVYIDRRKWADHVLGFSAYWENGLRVDLSFMPASDIPILSKKWKLLWSKDDVLESSLKEKSDQLAPNAVVVDGSYHHAFFICFAKQKLRFAGKTMSIQKWF